ncbi:hypothetical protein PROFUN_14804 [Planoprotostelium fungivorum]|uniref:DDB1- and CUL4-associated factor 13 n=1 Tax=Planoprotostelium fungivorum TaxID=1890364 RepID=A0A2P6MYQ0_9EUKA|nr:hypothetical protein PROFUN_14804 [Planoprotostelium fungivorum]
MPKIVSVKTISRTEEKFARERPGDLFKTHQIQTEEAHPHMREREWKKALNATKLERMFAKPFVGALSGHRDTPMVVARHPKSITTFMSGSADGQVRIWNLTNKATVWSEDCHVGMVTGIAAHSDGKIMLTCGKDSKIKSWDLTHVTSRHIKSFYSGLSAIHEEDDKSTIDHQCLQTWLPSDKDSGGFRSLDIQRGSQLFATGGGEVVSLWDLDRAKPVYILGKGGSSFHHVKFSQVETNLLSSLDRDRKLVLYDVRQRTAIKQLVTTMSANALSWRPMDGHTFATASEDNNGYIWDMRLLSTFRAKLKGHVGAVVDIDWSPVGNELVTASFDTSLRLWPLEGSRDQWAYEIRARDVYTAARVQKVTQVKYTGDAQYVVAASTDLNLRLWKSIASKPMRILSEREEKAQKYTESLKKRYENTIQINRIARHRSLASDIYKKMVKHKIISTAGKKKQQRIEQNAKEFGKKVTKKRDTNVVFHH